MEIKSCLTLSQKASAESTTFCLYGSLCWRISLTSKGLQKKKKTISFYLGFWPRTAFVLCIWQVENLGMETNGASPNRFSRNLIRIGWKSISHIRGIRWLLEQEMAGYSNRDKNCGRKWQRLLNAIRLYLCKPYTSVLRKNCRFHLLVWFSSPNVK
jgi:hypothetical protein